MSWCRLGRTGRITVGGGCQVFLFFCDRGHLPSSTVLHVCRESRKSQCRSLFVLYKKIFYPRVLVVSSVCCVFAHLQNIQNCLACPSVCVLLFVLSVFAVSVCVFFFFSYPNAICLFPIHPFPRQVLAAAALWSLAMC